MKESTLDRLRGYKLLGGFTIVRIRITDDQLVDAIGREALARTRIVGRDFEIEIRRLADEEISVSLYHEILEAATVAAAVTPSSVAMFHEADFERAARTAHDQFGQANPENLDGMLQSYGFREQ